MKYSMTNFQLRQISFCSISPAKERFTVITVVNSLILKYHYFSYFRKYMIKCDKIMTISFENVIK